MTSILETNVCPRFGQYQAECDGIVTEFLPAAAGLLARNIAPAQVCQQLTLCGSSSVTTTTTEAVAVAKPEASEGGFCAECKAIVAFVESYLSQNATEHHIAQKLDSLCKKLGGLAAPCEAFVKDELPTIINYLEKKENPTQVCTKIHVCHSSAAALNALVALEAPVPAGATLLPAAGFCSTCEAIVGFAEHYLAENSSVAFVEAELKHVCALTPFAAECDALVDTYTPQLVHYIEADENATQICKQVGACASSALDFADVLVARGGDDYCGLCQDAVGFVENWAHSNTSIAEIEQYLDAVCAVVPSLTATCKALVAQYTPSLIAYIASNEKPQKVCTDVGVCAAESSELVELVEPTAVVAVDAPEGGFCSICEAIVSFVESYVEQNKTVMEITHKLEGLCTLTGPYAAECKALVDQYLPQLIHYVEQKETPAHACAQVGACASQEAASALVELLAAQPAEPEEPEAGFCSICEAIVGFVESYVEQNHTVMEITHKLEGLCTLTGPYAAECKALVDQYLPQLIHYVEQKETPAHACAQVGACASEELAGALVELLAAPTAAAAAAAADAPEGGFCSICEAIVSFVESYVEQNKTVMEITHKLEGLCKLTGPYAAECKALVDQYLPQLIHYVEQKETPAHACAQVGACASEQLSGALVELLTAERGVAAVGDNSHCDLCKTLVGIVYAFIGHGVAEQKIEHMLDQACALAKSFKPQCDALVAQYTPQIIKWVQQKESPEKICDKLHLCAAPTPAPSPAAAALEAVGASSEECVVCELVVSVGDHFAAQNSTVQFVEQKIDELCKAAPPKYQATCVALSHTYVPELDGWFLGKTKHLCVDSGFCAKNN